MKIHQMQTCRSVPMLVQTARAANHHALRCAKSLATSDLTRDGQIWLEMEIRRFKNGVTMMMNRARKLRRRAAYAAAAGETKICECGKTATVCVHDHSRTRRRLGIGKKHRAHFARIGYFCAECADAKHPAESGRIVHYNHPPVSRPSFLASPPADGEEGGAAAPEGSAGMVVPSAVAPQLPDDARETKIPFLRDALAVCQRASNETIDPSGEISQKEIEAGCPSFSDFGVIGIVENLHYEYRLAVEEQGAEADGDWEELGKALREANRVMR